MIEWEYHDCRPAGFEYYKAKWGELYSIAVSKLCDTSDKYCVRWYYKDMTEIKEYIHADDWDEAKADAIAIVKGYFTRQATYWRDMKLAFSNWVKE